METNNEFVKIANGETTKLAASIMKGDKVDVPQNGVQMQKTEQDILKAITDTYKQIINPEPPKES